MIITTEKLANLGSHLKKQLDTFVADRRLLEEQWLRNLRQYMGKYDPSVEENIPDERSHVYPRDTRVKIKGGVAKMMEMMFPAQDRNWDLQLSPMPSIPKENLEEIIFALQSQVDPETQQPEQVTSDDIERAVREFASKRMEQMEKEIDDQLLDPGIDYPQICKKVVRSGYIYGVGVARSPMVRTQKERFWRMNEETGDYEAVVEKIRRPYPEYVRVWDVYPDLAAKAWEDQDMIFERYVLSRHGLRKLGKRPDFDKNAIKQYLRNNPTGNYTARSYETELQELAKSSNLADRTARRYEVYRALGFVSAHTLRDVGVKVEDDELDQDILADLWIIDNAVIKARKASFGARPSDQYHAFIYAEDEDSGLTGIGLPEEVRDSQMSLCASTRALMDNMASVAGPIFEVNEDLLPPGRKVIGPIHAFKTIPRIGDGIEASYPAVRDISTNAHVGEYIEIISMHRNQLDIESNLPAYTMGSIQDSLGEAFRTTNNMSMMMGSANMITKDTVRAFDKFTNGVVGSLLAWNMEFNPKDEIKGDYQVRAKGNISLVAKEVRGAALDQFVSTLSPEERAILDTYGLLVDRLKARDLPTNRVFPRDEAEAILQRMSQAAAQSAQMEEGLTQAKTAETQAGASKKEAEALKISQSVEATIQEILSRVEANMANAQSAEDRTQLENLKTLLSTATQTEGQNNDGS